MAMDKSVGREKSGKKSIPVKKFAKGDVRATPASPTPKAGHTPILNNSNTDWMASTATPNASPRDQLRQLLLTVKAVRAGDFTSRMPLAQEGIISEIGEVLNDIIEMNENMASEFVRVRNTVGQEGRMNERVSLGSVKGSWSTSVNHVNLHIGDLVQPTQEIARVITTVAQGDLSQKMALEIDGRVVKGEFLRIGNTVNGMVDQLNSFASEVTRVAKEVGTEGRLGGQAEVRGASGV